MENQQEPTIQPIKKSREWGMIIFIFLTQLVLTIWISLSYGFSNFGGGEQYLRSNTILPIFIIFLFLALSLKRYIDFRRGKNNFGLKGLIISLIFPVCIIIMIL